MNYNIRHLQPIPPVKIVFSIVLFLLSAYLFFLGTLFGVILAGAALKLALREGIELDLGERKYRKVYSIFAINIGVWKRLPDIEYVSVFKTIKKSRARVISAEANMGFEVYKLNLFHDRNKHIESYVTDDRDDAFAVAKHIAMALDTEVWDATEK